jgi:hypothetical protein
VHKTHSRSSFAYSTRYLNVIHISEENDLFSRVRLTARGAYWKKGDVKG